MTSLGWFSLFMGTYCLIDIFWASFLTLKISLPGQMYPCAWLLLPCICWELPHYVSNTIVPQLQPVHLLVCLTLPTWHPQISQNKSEERREKYCFLLSYSFSTSFLLFFLHHLSKVSEMLSPEIAKKKSSQSKTQIHSNKPRIVKSWFPLPRVFFVSPQIYKLFILFVCSVHSTSFQRNWYLWNLV